MFSGLMSMGPWGIFNSATSPIPQINRYYGNDSLRLSNLPMPDSRSNLDQIKEVEWHQLKDKSFYSFISSPTETEVRFSNNSALNVKYSEDLLLISKIMKSNKKKFDNKKIAYDRIINVN